MAGSERRQRGETVTIRVTSDEKASLTAKASRAGLTLASYSRQTLINVAPPRQSRRPSVEAKAVAKLLAETGRIGGNVNQIARKLNAGNSADSAAIAEIAGAIIVMRDNLLIALGRAP